MSAEERIKCILGPAFLNTDLSTACTKVVQLEEVRKNQLLDAFRCFERGIQLDPHHPLLQHSIGTAYYFGRGVTQDCLQAYVWVRKAAEQGNANAEYCLGVLYDNGEGVAQDLVRRQHGSAKPRSKAILMPKYRLDLPIRRVGAYRRTVAKHTFGSIWLLSKWREMRWLPGGGTMSQ